MNLNHVQRVDRMVPIRRVLVSTADKSGLVDFIRSVAQLTSQRDGGEGSSLEVFATGGTYRTLVDDAKGYSVTSVESITGQPELQGGLVKTLDFRLHTAILSERYNESHEADRRRLGIDAIDMVVVNLYPFARAVVGADATVETARSHIDIGGPTMLRGAAKNFLRVAAVCRPNDYDWVIARLRAQRGRLSIADRFRLAQTAFSHSAAYEAEISRHLATYSPDSVIAAYEVADDL